jgi:hypothetical protein
MLINNNLTKSEDQDFHIRYGDSHTRQKEFEWKRTMTVPGRHKRSATIKIIKTEITVFYNSQIEIKYTNGEIDEEKITGLYKGTDANEVFVEFSDPIPLFQKKKFY